MSQKISKSLSKIKKISIYTISAFIVAKLVVFAGNLIPESTPTTSTMVTLGDLYEKITNNSYTASSHPVSTTTSPASTFSTLESIYNAIPDISGNAASILSNTSIMGIQGTLSIPSASQVATGTVFGPNANGETIGTLPVTAPVLPDTISAWSVAKSTGTWGGAILFCNNLAEDGANWRLPKIAELAFALEEQFKSNPSYVDHDFASNSAYWSGVESDNNPTNEAYYGIYYTDINYNHVYSFSGSKGQSFLIRCVH
ncbi:MAG: DUF1566 domain-containing protein [Candidatus Paceibacterota bacterium]|jgi:hypothetical protein